MRGSGHSFVHPLKMAFYLCENFTTFKTVDIALHAANRAMYTCTRSEKGKFTEPKE